MSTGNDDFWKRPDETSVEPAEADGLEPTQRWDGEEPDAAASDAWAEGAELTGDVATGEFDVAEPESGAAGGAASETESDDPGATALQPVTRTSAAEREARSGGAASEAMMETDAGAADDDPADQADVEGDAEAPGPTVPGRFQRLSGTISVAALLVVAALFGVWWVVKPPEPEPPAPRWTPTPVVIPQEARTKIYRSTTVGTGEYTVAGLTIAPATTAKATNTYAVRVEGGTNIDPEAAATFIQKVLDDPRSWAGFGNNNFSLLPTTEGTKLVITIASPATTDQLCGTAAKTQGLSSCRVKDAIVINSDRWHYMTPTYNNVEEYRAYVVNHLTGQFLGQRIAFCAKKGGPAPAMAQQDVNLDGCLPNAWPKLP